MRRSDQQSSSTKYFNHQGRYLQPKVYSGFDTHNIRTMAQRKPLLTGRRSVSPIRERERISSSFYETKTLSDRLFGQMRRISPDFISMENDFSIQLSSKGVQSLEPMRSKKTLSAIRTKSSYSNYHPFSSRSIETEKTVSFPRLSRTSLDIVHPSLRIRPVPTFFRSSSMHSDRVRVPWV